MSAVSPRRGLFYVVLAAVFFSLNASVSKVALDGGIDPTRLAALRSTGAALVLLLVLLLTRGPAGLRMTRREFPFLLVLGVFGGALVQWLYFTAIDRLPVGIALLLEFTAPAMVALFTWGVLRRRIGRRTWCGIGVALLGLALVAQVWADVGLDLVGVLAGLGAAACLASYYLIGGRLSVHRDSLSLTFWMFGFAAVFWAIVLPWWSFDPAPLRRSTSLLGVFADVEVPVWSAVAWVIVFGTLVAYGLNVAALRHISPTTAGTVGMSEPVGAALVAWVWLGQSLTAVQMVGGGLVLIGVAMADVSRSEAADADDLTPTEPVLSTMPGG
jgi:drug/metabolite transporter (DMT)-like permease